MLPSADSTESVRGEPVSDPPAALKRLEAAPPLGLSPRRILMVAGPVILVMVGWAAWSTRPAAQPLVQSETPRFDVEPDVAPTDPATSLPQTSTASLSAGTTHLNARPLPPDNTTSDEPSSRRALAQTGATPPGDWPAPYGPFHDGCSRETGLRFDWDERGPGIAWEAPIGLGYNIPVVAHGTLFAWSRYGDVERLEARAIETGALRWSTEFPASYVSPFDYSAGPHASPVVVDGIVYILGAAGEARAMRADDGRLLWERHLKRDYRLPDTPYSLGASPLVAEGIVVLQLPGKESGAGLVGLDAATGETLWTATNHGLSFATPRLVPGSTPPTFIAFTTFGVLHVDLRTGRLIDQFKFGVGESRERVNAVAPVLIGERVYAIAGPGPGTLALSLEPDGKFRLLWRNRRLLDSQYTSVIWHEGHLYGFNSLWNGTCELRCIDTAEARQVWALESDLRRGQLIYADGRLIALGEKGHLGVIDLRRATLATHGSGESVVRTTSTDDQPDIPPPPHVVTRDPFLEGACYSAPALADGRLILRNERRLVVIDCRPRPTP